MSTSVPCCLPSSAIRLFSIPIDTAEMARHFVLSAEDLTLIRTKRRAANRLGFAIQLCALRHPGRVLGPAELPPEPMLAFVGKQLGIDPALFGDYARRAETRREHMIELQKLLRLRTFGFADWRACLKAGTDAAWATDRGEPIVQAMIDHLRANNVILPAVNMSGADRAGGTGARPEEGFRSPGGRPDRCRSGPRSKSLLANDPELSPVPLCLAAGLLGIARTLQHGRAAGPARITRDPWDSVADDARRIHPEPPYSPGRAKAAIMTAQHIADLEPAQAHRHPGGAGRPPRDPRRRRHTRHVREIHRLAVHQGPQQGRATLPGDPAGCGEGPAAVPAHDRAL